MYDHDHRVVLTLDAGGTNFVFSAVKANNEIMTPFCLPACPDNLGQCLDALFFGFQYVKEHLDEMPVAISFAFPGPADYEHGVIGDLPNFPSFRGGVALSGYLEDRFNIPVFINNDGNLFAYGEALSGVLPYINEQLAHRGNLRRYENLIGITFGTGFGSGVVINNCLLKGDNGCGGDIWVSKNKLYPSMIAEESVSIRGLLRVYDEIGKLSDEKLTPKDLFEIAEGAKTGNREAALECFRQFGSVAGDAIASMLSFADGLVVLGGGIVGAAKYIMPSLMDEMRQRLSTFNGNFVNRVEADVFDLTDAAQMNCFLDNKVSYVTIPGSERTVPYNAVKQTGVMLSKLGTNRAVCLGAYAYALSKIDEACIC